MHSVRRTIVPIALFMLLAPGALQAEDRLAGILPVVGSTPGAQGASFKTGLQLTNPTDAAIEGTLIFRPQGTQSSPDDPRLSFDLAPRATRSYEDVVAEMGASGLGSLEVIVSAGGSPVVVARAFADGEGTRGVTVPLVSAEEALEAGRSATLLVPGDLERYRFNLGVRSLEAGASLRFAVYGEDGTLRGEAGPVVYAASLFEQRPAEDVVEMALEPNDSIVVSVEGGSAIVYATTTDNTTNDPSFQLDELINQPPVLVSQSQTLNLDGTITIVLVFEDPDGDPVDLKILGQPDHGTLGAAQETEEGTFQIVYTSSGESQSDAFTIEVGDGQGNSEQITIGIEAEVEPNQDPTAAGQSLTTDEDDSLLIQLEGSDPDGDALEFRIVSGPGDGGLTGLTSTGDTEARVRYTPDADFNGTDSFTFEVSDGNGGTAEAEVEIRVRPVSDAPAATGGSFTTLEGQLLTVPAPGVLAGDADADGDALNAVLETDVANGTLVLSADGSFTYQPDPDFFGTDGFTYRASDGTEQSAAVSVTITVTAVNDAPVALGDGPFPTDEDTLLTVPAPGVLVNDIDIDSSLTAQVVADAGNGTLTLGAGGGFTYRPDANYSGADSFTYQAFDGGLPSNVVTVTLDVTAVNDGPSVLLDGISAGADFAASFTEDGGAVAIVNPAGLTVTDVDSGTLASATVTFAPLFNAGLETLAVNLGAAPGTAIFTAYDVSIPFVEILTLTGPAPLGEFEAVLRTLTYANASEDPNPSDRQVRVVVNDGFLDSNFAFSTVSVEAVNDQPEADDATFTIDENSANGMAVGTVTASDVDASQTLSFAITGGNGLGGFEIDANTGAITVADTSQLDFDTTPSFTLEVTVSDDGPGTLSDTATITIDLVDLNENPVVTDETFTLDENSGNGTPVGTVSFTDQDAGQTHTYAITGGNGLGAFAIDASTGEITVADTTDLDFETTPSFTLTVTVTDDGAGFLTGTGTITIDLSDINEAPVADDATFAIDENSANGTAVGTVTASDVDAGQNLSYAITAGDAGGAFAIDATSGEITVADSTELDFETTPTFNLTVTVSDNGTGALSDTAAITINLNDLNEAPIVDAATLNVDENSANGTSVGTVSFTENDGGGQTHTFAITAGNGSGAFAIDPTTGAIAVADSSQLNFEVTPSYSLTVEVTDNGAPAATGSAAITVGVNDVNDAPVVAPQTFAVDENSIFGFPVGTVVSTDEDAGQTRTYAITAGNTGTTFAIDATSGEITVADNTLLDFETNPTFTLTVEATDDGALPLSGSGTVTVNVGDRNEGPTISSPAGTSLPRAENTTAVTTLTASDPDVPAQTLTFSIVAGLDGAVFAIDPSTGALSFNPAPDFENPVDGETDNFYQVGVQVSDGAINDSVTLTIEVLDANDAPVITSSASVSAAENQSGAGIVSADDQDVPADPLTFSIVGGADQLLFSIDASIGILTFLAAPDFENPGDADADNDYELDLQVFDGTVATPQSVTVTVTDENDAPAITSGAALSAVENQTVAGTVTASDQDTGDTLTFSITGGADELLLSIDPGTGALSFNTASDFEAPADAGGDNTYVVDVEVSDGTITDSQTVTVTVTDENDAPEITSGAAFNAAENQTAAGTVTATDQDLDTLTFTITGGTEMALFSIDSSGALTFVAAPDFENPADAGANNVYEVEVTVDDGSGGTDVQLISVTVTNENDDPVIATTALSAAENQTAAGTVVATDQDLPAQTLAFSITGGTEQFFFTIHGGSGALTFNAAPDFELPGDSNTDNDYEVEVTVDDGTGSDVQIVIVTVTDENDAPTAVDDADTTDEDTLFQIDVLANDTDADAGDTKTIVSLDTTGSTGSVTHDGAQVTFDPDGAFEGLDDTESQQTTFTYTMEDGAGAQSTATVTVTVNGINDAPVVTAGATLAHTEGDGPEAIDTTITVADVDDANLAGASIEITGNYAPGEDVLAFTPLGSIVEISNVGGVLTLGGTDTVANYQAALRSVTYENTSINPSTLQRTISWTVDDDAGPSNTATSFVDVTSVNDPPVLGVSGALSYAEGDGAVVIEPALTVTDGDDVNFEQALVQISGDYREGEDLLAVGNPGGLGVAWDAPSGTLSLTGTATLGTYQTALRSVTYENTSDTPTTLDRTVAWVVIDGTDLDQALTTITVAATNDLPLIDLDGDDDKGTAGADFAVTFTEGDGPTLLEDPDDPTGATITDVDSTTLVSMMVTLTNLLDAGEELLDADVSPLTDVTKVYDTTTPGEGVLTITTLAPQPIADWIAVLRTVTYEHTGEDPDPTARVVEFVVNDGSDDSNTATSTVTIAPADDDPVAVDDAETVGEDSGANVLDVLFNDTDVDGGTKTIATASDPANGTVVIAGDDLSLTYEPDPGYCGADSFTYTISPGGDEATVSVTVTCLNDPPVGTENTVTTEEDTSLAFSAADFGFTDPNDTPVNAFLAVKITGLTGPGSLTLSGSPVAEGDFVAVADLAGPNLVFTPLANQTGSPYTSFTFQVQDDGGTGGGGVDLDPTPKTMWIEVTNINDAPAGTDQSFTLNEEQSVTFTGGAADFGFTDPDDLPPNAMLNLVITTLPANGSLTFMGNPVVVDQVIPAASLGSFGFAPDPNEHGTPYATFGFQVQDDGGTANGGIDLDPIANIYTINVNSVNDEPSGTDATLTTNEDISLGLAAASFGLTDPNDTPANALFAVRITSLPGVGSLTLSGNPVAVNDLIFAGSLGSLFFTPASNQSGNSYASFNFQVLDDGGTANGGVNLDATPNTITIDVLPVNDPPVADNESFETIGNTELRIDFGTTVTPHILYDPADTNSIPNDGVLDGDADPVEGDAILIAGVVGCGDVTAPFDCTLPSGAIVGLQPDGKFSFKPAAGKISADSFQYILEDDGGTANGGLDTAIGTVSITFPGGQRTWYVRNNAGGGGDGRSHSPFNSLASAQIAAGATANSRVFVHFGDGTTTNQNLGYIFGGSSQTLHGEGVALTTGTTVNGAADATLVVAGSRPLIGNSAGAGVFALNRNGITIQGLSIAGTLDAIDLTTSAAVSGTSTIANNTIRSGGTGNGIDINGDPGTSGTSALSITGNTWDVAGTFGAPGIHVVVQAGAMHLAVSGNTNVIGVGGGTAGGISIVGAGITITAFDGNTVHGNTSGGGITVASATFDATPGGNLDSVDGGITLVGAPANLVTSAGVVLSSVSGSLAFDDLDIYTDGRGLLVSGTGVFTGAAGTEITVTPSSGGGTSTIANQAGEGVDVSSATIDLRLASLTTSTSQEGLDLSGITGQFGAAAGSITKGSGTGTGFVVSNSVTGSTITYDGSLTVTAGSGVSLSNNTGSTITFNGPISLSTLTNPGFSATGGGTVNVSDPGVAGNNTITTTSGTALSIQGTAVGSSGVYFDAVSSNFAANGIVIDGAGANAITIDGGSIQNATSRGIDINGGSGNFSYAGSITTNNAAAIPLEVTNHTGGTVTVSGAISNTGTSGGINLTGNGGATITLSGNLNIDTTTATGLNFTGGGTLNISGSTANTIDATTGTGVVLNAVTLNTSNSGLDVTKSDAGTAVSVTGGTVAIATGTGDGLDINSGAASAFVATSGGTVTLTGSNNTITSTTGTGLNVANTTIGANDLTFRSINVTGNNTNPTNGIILNNTGTSGGLKVSGDGGSCTPALSTCTGGTIQNTGSHGVSATSTSNLEFNLVSIHNTGDHGIFGDGVHNFTLRDCRIFNFGNTAGGAVSEDAMHFESTNLSNTAAGHGLTGTVIIQRNNIGPDGNFTLTPFPALPENKGIVIRNHNDLDLHMTVTGTKFLQISNDGIDADIRNETDVSAGVGTATINVDGSTDDGANDFNQINGRAVVFQNAVDNAAARIFELTIKNNTFNLCGIGGRWAASGRGTMNARYNDNTMTNTTNDAIRSESDAVNAALTPHATVNATVSNNTMGGGSIFISLHRQALTNMTFTGNTNIGGTAAGVGGAGSTGVHTGMNLRSDRGSTLNIDIQSNTATADGSLAFAQSSLDMQATDNGGGASSICAKIGGAGALKNTFTQSPDTSGQQVISIDPAHLGTTIRVEGGPGGSPGTENFLIVNNTLNGSNPVAISSPARVPSGVGSDCVTSTP